MTQAAPAGVSLRPSSFVTGGGLIDDADLQVKKAIFANWQYPGTSVVTIAAILTLLADDDTEYEQTYTCGDPKNFTPSPDGKRLVAVGQATGLADSTNMAAYLNSLIAAGFPEDRLSEDISTLEGLYAHWRRVPQAQRAGLANNRKEANKDREQTVLIVSEIKNLPWEASKRAGAAGSNGATPARAAAPRAARVAAPAAVTTPEPEAASETDGSVADICQAFIEEAIAEPPFEISAKELAQNGYKKFNAEKHPLKTQISKALFDAGFLREMANVGVCSFDEQTMMVGAA